MITRTQVKQQKKEVTAEMISMPDYKSTATKLPFELKLKQNEASSSDDYSNEVL